LFALDNTRNALDLPVVEPVMPLVENSPLRGAPAFFRQRADEAGHRPSTYQ